MASFSEVGGEKFRKGFREASRPQPSSTYVRTSTVLDKARAPFAESFLAAHRCPSSWSKIGPKGGRATDGACGPTSAARRGPGSSHPRGPRRTSPNIGPGEDPAY